jgi:two-component system, OmpR family, response regulator
MGGDAARLELLRSKRRECSRSPAPKAPPSFFISPGDIDMNLHAVIPILDGVDLLAAPRAAPPRSVPAGMVLVIGAALKPLADAADMRAAGLRCLCVASPEQALAAAPSMRFDAVVLYARGLGGDSGVWLTRLRETLACPIVLVADATDQTDEIDEIVALELGADAFLVHPLAPRRLRAHLLRLIQQWRSSTGRASWATRAWTAAAASVDLGRWKINPVRNWISCGATVVQLTEGQAALLLCLADAHGGVVPRRQLLGMLNARSALADRSVDVYVSRLRRLLARHGVADLLLLTVRGRGYALHVAEGVHGVP